jgi:hypothetical protein
MTSFLVALIVPILLAVLGTASRLQARRHAGKYVVEYGAPLKWIAWVLGIMASGVAVGSLFVHGIDRIYLLATSGIFVLPAMILFPVCYGTWIEFDDQGMRIKNPLKRPFFAKWVEIMNVVGGPARGSYTLVLKEGIQVQVSGYMSGVQTLLKEMQRRGIHGALLAEAMQGNF